MICYNKLKIYNIHKMLWVRKTRIVQMYNFLPEDISSAKTISAFLRDVNRYICGRYNT